MKNKGYAEIWSGGGRGGANMVGALWEMWKWRITRLHRKMGKNSSPKTDPQVECNSTQHRSSPSVTLEWQYSVLSVQIMRFTTDYGDFCSLCLLSLYFPSQIE